MKKLLASALVLALSAAIFAGCNTSGTSSASGSSSTPGISSEQEPTTPVKISFVDFPRTSATDDQAVLDYLNKKFNIDLNWVGPVRDTFDQTFSTMLASQTDINFFTGFYADRASVRSVDVLREKDVIIPLDDLLSKYGTNLLKNVDQKYWDLAKTSGKTWFIPNVQFAEKTFMWYRQDWLDKIGYTTDKLPKTIDEFETMLRKLKSDNPGKIENFYPLVAENMVYLTNCLLNSFTGTMPTYLDNGTLKPSLLHPNYKKYLETMNKWYKDGLLNPDQATVTGTVLTDLLSREKAGVWISWFTNSKQTEIQKANSSAVVNFFGKIPTGPSGVGGACSTNILSGGGAVITKWTTDIQRKKIVQLLDWLNTEEGQMFNWYGIKDKHWIDAGNNMVDLPAGVTAANRPYNEKYLISGGNMYKFFKESKQTQPAITATARQAGITGKYKTIDPPDYMLPYDWSKYASKDYMTDLNTMQTKMINDIITGTKPVSYYDTFITEWKKAGGDQYLKDLDAQYQALKKK